MGAGEGAKIMDDKKILFSIKDGKVVEKTYYIICDKFVDIDEDDVYSKEELRDCDIFESKKEAEALLLKPQFLPIEEKLKIIKELELGFDVTWAFRIYSGMKTYKVLEKLDISTELRYYLESKLNAYDGALPAEAKVILSAFDVTFK